VSLSSGIEARPRPAPQPAVEGERRIGVLGGTFDPPHIGHLWLATLAADELKLDRVLFLPAARPPHKRDRPITAVADRLLMTRLAIGGEPLFELSILEVGRAGASYTVDSLEELQRLYGDEVRLFWLMAVDSLVQVDTWRDPDRILGLAEWAVAPRPGSVAPSREELDRRFGEAASRIHLLEGPGLDVSASEIRSRVAARRAIRYLVPRAVEAVIVERRLYRRAT
jgi:nicotinate-nucleotide adenylyltransferase